MVRRVGLVQRLLQRALEAVEVAVHELHHDAHVLVALELVLGRHQAWHLPRQLQEAQFALDALAQGTARFDDFDRDRGRLEATAPFRIGTLVHEPIGALVDLLRDTVLVVID